MERLKKVAALENEIQAQLLDSMLTDRDIPHIIRSYHDTALDGIFQTASGWGHVEAPLEFHENVKAALAEIADRAAGPWEDLDADALSTEDSPHEE